MPTENRSSNTEMVSVPPYIGLEPLVGRYYPAQCRRCGWLGSSEELTEDDAQCTRDIGDRLCLGDCDELERHDLLNIIQAMAAPQPHAEPIAWMVGTAFWWTKEEAERDAEATGLPIVGLGPMTNTSEVERMNKATAFVQRLVDCSGTQPSVATGYLRDILDELKGNTKPSAPVDLDERAAFEHHHRVCDLVRDEDCPDYYRNQSVQDSWEGWQARAEQEVRP
ncbi:hypothetical protein [Pseudomonas putida]|uniref:hypothetical protein n=1 Tax=Pseudomonas putida TaxID=303 RepID=UPI0011AF5DF2|nr:hypothetical protein [Pseudomonas putida]